MSEEKRQHRPGETVPESGIYECDCGEAHRWSSEQWSTDVQGHTFPPTPCRGGTWKLRTPAHRE